MHSILEPISPPCGAKLHCEPPSHLILQSLTRAVPSSKPCKTVDREHQVGPWLIQCRQDLQRSVDFKRSLLFKLCRGVVVASFWSSSGSSASFVSLKPWNPQHSRHSHLKPGPVYTIILWVAGGRWCKHIRGERYLCTHQ